MVTPPSEKENNEEIESYTKITRGCGDHFNFWSACYLNLIRCLSKMMAFSSIFVTANSMQEKTSLDGVGSKGDTCENTISRDITELKM